MTPPHGLAELQQRYGKLLLGPDPHGGLRIISPLGWETANMTLLHELPGLPQHKLYVHRDLAAPLTAALAAAQLAWPTYAIRTIGCWNPRYKRTKGGDISVHAWGLAVDINAAANPMGSPTWRRRWSIASTASAKLAWPVTASATKYEDRARREAVDALLKLLRAVVKVARR